MGTRCYIGRLKKDGSVEAFYVQLNGMPSETGVRLKRSYQSQEKTDALFRRGSIDRLEDNPEDSPPNRWIPGEICKFSNPQHYLGSMGYMINFAYLYDGTKWKVARDLYRPKVKFVNF